MNQTQTELKKVIYSFNRISNRLMKAHFQDYLIVLKRFLTFIHEHEIICKYVENCGLPNFDVNAEYVEVAKSSGCLCFDLGETDEKEVANIVGILQYVVEKNIDMVRTIGFSYSRSTKIQDILDEINKRVVFVLVMHISDYLTEIGIDMGLDETKVAEINVNGQFNVANDSATINATINNGFDTAKLLELINAVKAQSVGILPKDEMESVQESLDVIETELKQMTPRKSFVKTAISTLKGIKVSNEIKEAAEFSAAMAALIQFISTSGLL